MKQDYIVIVDDESNIRLSLSGLLSDEGYTVKAFPDSERALDFIKKHPVSLILLDIWLQHRYEGIDVLGDIKNIDDNIQVIMMSGHGTINLAVECIRKGAFDFLEKPFTSEKVFITIENAIRLRQLRSENQIFKSIIQDQEKLLGSSCEIQDVKGQIAKIAKTNASILIMGENGTGKELVARSIHNLSSRKDRAFISINCAAVPNTLLESEFFGYEKGAFTGADKKKTGKLEMADGGTLFLDEIGDMDISSQSKILKVIEDCEFMRLGGIKNINVDLRFISATNHDLEDLVSRGQFREDLFFRLNVIPIKLPSLRQRKEDIPILISHFAEKYSREHKGTTTILDEQAVYIMTQYAWPGNVRELKNYIERLIILTDKQIISEKDLLPPVKSGPELSLFNEDKTLKEAKDEFERYYIKKILDSAKGNVSRASEILKIDRTSLHRKIKALMVNGK